MTAILQRFRLGNPPWPTADPFLFAVHHVDDYPAGDGALAPSVPVADRSLGMDFGHPSGWSMYHGERVPGFPGHPHRGFETVTIVLRGVIDHSDSLGAAARFGAGDTQWLTAGGGIVHSEMFPLLDTEAGNPLELFQIWLNLPAASKGAAPHFSMFWAEETPRVRQTDDEGRAAEVLVVAGAFGDTKPLSPPPESWASNDVSDVAIWNIALDPGARLALPTAPDGVNRVAYLYDGDVTVDGEQVPEGTGIVLDVTNDVTIGATETGAHVLVLQGRPIGEPVVQHGPFVLNDEAGVRQAFLDYQRTGFGGWPWDDMAPTHGDEARRFARHPDGRVETPA
ncbi:MAG TPA: pirin family protein [Mycobacteriales bacterium]|nr:pirin family protein [Mycobacteriales bacterium]